FIIRAKYGENFTYPTTPYFTDVPATNDYFKYVQRLKYDAITTLTGTYRINDPVTRGEMAAFIIRGRYGENFTYPTTPYFTDVPTTNTYFKYVQRLKQDNITTQTGIYRVNDVVLREEMAAFLSRGFLGMQ
ncbi:MAG: S-layer homology domain-containing protein, partial [Thermodesulfovibrionales bacterium]|nr:S-layer homology domain-containing protein [Thermodesulfovibrionales bacterium]